MITCSNCRSNQMDGAIFCLECGASLMTAGEYETTRPLAGDASSTSLRAPEAQAPEAAEGAAVALVVVRTRRRFALDLSDELLIGRADTARGIYPDIDLGPEGGYDAGVSRRHAILAMRGEGCFVEDLGSSNGTYVNGVRLAPQVATPLANGDELACGTLRMRVELG